MALPYEAHADIPNTRVNALHALNRLAYGPAPGDVERVQHMGIDAYIEEQLHPERLAMPQQLQKVLAELPTLNMSLAELSRNFPPARRMEAKGTSPTPEEKKMARQKMKTVSEELRQAKLWRAIYSPAQLQEVMTDFWYNHFNVYDEKAQTGAYVGAYERDAIRKHAMGKFRDLLEATARHPAMLIYLDNWLNTDPNGPAAKGKFKGLNENYAREIMELHTLGVDGGYTQADVTMLARIFTGWGITPDKKNAPLDMEFYFEDRRHDKRSKVFLDRRIIGGGSGEAERAMDMLAYHPSTAKHISYELAQYFVADDPPESLVKVMAQTFTQSGGDIREVLSTMFHSPEFWDVKYNHEKFKPPFRYVVSAFRASNEPAVDTQAIMSQLHGMGQPLYHCLTPDGYPATTTRWLGSDALLRRQEFAKVLVSGRFSYEKNDKPQTPPEHSGADPHALMATLGNEFSAQSKAAFSANSNDKLQATLILASPEFLYY